ncbi:hypothetical protein OESDEN_20165 [Oesophagostomum dentatum]|uniref:Uncharacterized protein n=1 Tax=Oesophagostomum dentatum TaxID=61180 RepID=A0A0B1S8H1_OESDE|nr:hypothetical protein OESDEN_20165 [Oesophagostomum dentatum]
MDIVGCIQGPSSYNTSFENCIVGNSKLNQQSIYECSNSREGKTLLMQHGDASRRIAPDVFWVDSLNLFCSDSYLLQRMSSSDCLFKVPWISIDGLRIPAAENHFEQVLCLQYFQPPPPECQNLRA